MAECLSLLGCSKGMMTDDSLVVSEGEVHDTSLVKRAVFTDHRPVQGVALLVGGSAYDLPRSVVME